MSEYSVLMSVYYKEKPEYLRQSIQSIFDQTVPTDDFVLVCDGPLTPELDAVIDEFAARLNVVRLSQNQGLGNALNTGLQHCKYELVARMDSDDISMANRCERQIQLFENNPELALASGTIVEFEEDPNIEKGRRIVPTTHEEIVAFSKRRNPFNHPAIMFRKSYVENAGNYQETYALFEDYSLWVRMLECGFTGWNLEQPLLYMRTPPDLYMRRGGVDYAKKMLRFRWWMHKIGWSSLSDFCLSALPQAIICILPNGIRKSVYVYLHK